MDISIDIMLFGKTYTIQPEVVNATIICIILSILGIYIGYKAKKADFRESPKGLLLVGELFVEAINKLVRSTMGNSNAGFIPYIGSLTLFLLVGNLIGLVGFKPPASNYNVALGLALVVFVLIHGNNIRFNGVGGYVKGYFEPYAFLAPVNILGDLSTPLSMSFRIFGNLLAGTIVMTLLYAWFNQISIWITPFLSPVFHAYFDVFSGLIQMVVFVMLTMINISDAIGDREEIEKED